MWTKTDGGPLQWDGGAAEWDGRGGEKSTAEGKDEENDPIGPRREPPFPVTACIPIQVSSRITMDTERRA